MVRGFSSLLFEGQHVTYSFLPTDVVVPIREIEVAPPLVPDDATFLDSDANSPDIPRRFENFGGASVLPKRVEPIKSAFPSSVLLGHNWSINSLVALDDVIFSASDDTTVISWDIKSSELLMKYVGHEAAITSLKVSSELCLYTGAADGTLRQWSIATGQTIRTFAGHTSMIHCLYLYDGILFSGGADGSARAWNTQTTDCIRCFAGEVTKIFDVKKNVFRSVVPGHTKPVSCMIACPSSKCLYTGSWDGEVRGWDLSDIHDRAVASKGNNKRNKSDASAAGSEDVVFDTATRGRCFRILRGHHDRINFVLALSAPEIRRNLTHRGNSENGKAGYVISAAADGRVLIFGPQGSTPDPLCAYGPFFRDGTSGPRAITSIIVCAAEMPSLLSSTTRENESSPYEVMDTIFFGTEFGDVHTMLFKQDSPEPVRSYVGIHRGAILGLVYRDQVLFTSGIDGQIKAWYTQSGDCIRLLAGHIGPVRSMISAGNHQLWSAGDDRTVRSWDVAALRVVSNAPAKDSGLSEFWSKAQKLAKVSSALTTMHKDAKFRVRRTSMTEPRGMSAQVRGSTTPRPSTLAQHESLPDPRDPRDPRERDFAAQQRRKSMYAQPLPPYPKAPGTPGTPRGTHVCRAGCPCVKGHPI